MKIEKDPYGRNPHEAGAKLDAGKSPVRRGLLEYFPRACMAVADVSAAGAAKYTWGGWLTVPEGVDRYGDAEVRHICKSAIEGKIDRDYGLHHAAHEAWNALARLELILQEEEYAAKRVSAISAKDAAATIGRDVLPTEPSWGSGGAIGGYSQSSPQGYIGGYFDGEKRVG